MSLRQRAYFFDPTNTDRFNSRDIPTEQTMLDWSESVPFIKEAGDRSQLTRAGIAKTTTDAKVNAGDNTDIPGVSPVGFTTFVRPGQLPRILNSASITWELVPRGGATNTDTGAGINDWRGNVNFPVIPYPEDTDELPTTVELEVRKLQGVVCDSLAVVSDTLPPGIDLTTVLVKFNDAITSIIDRITTIAALACTGQVDIGDVVMTVLPSSNWGPNWLEPNGQSLLVADYTALWNIIGYTYGGGGPSFNLPNLTTGNKYLRAKSGPVALLNSTGGSNSYTLTGGNLPAHTHTFSGNTNSDGAHSHAIPTDNNLGTANSVRTSDTSTGSFNLGSSGAHSHAFSGTTDSTGSGSPTPVAVEPEYRHVYLKMKVK